jgi:hypothetical protein
MWSYADARNKTNATATPRFANITLRDMVVENATGQVKQGAGWEQTTAGWAGALVGLPESPITGLLLDNVTVRLSPGVKQDPEVSAWQCSDIASGSASNVAPPIQKGCFVAN